MHAFLSVFAFLGLAGRSLWSLGQMSVNKMKLWKTGCFVPHWHIGFAVERVAKPVQIPGHGGTEWGPGPECVAYVSFLVVSGVITRWFIMSRVFAANGHLGVRHCQLCFPYRSARAGWHGKIFFTGTGTRCRRF
jgi:hypothetical protein